MPFFTLRHIAAACFGIAAAMATHTAPAADFPYPHVPGEEEADQPPDYEADRGLSRIYREERIDEEAPRPRAEGVPYGPRYTVHPRYAPPPPPQEECRTIIKHRVNGFGEEIRRRIRVCVERAPIGFGPRFRPSAYGRGPVPPANIPEEPYGDPRGY